MAIENDIAIDLSGNIYYTGAVHGAAGAGYYTVIQFHRYLQDLADDAVASGDDLIDITVDTPSDRSTDNIIAVLNGFRLDDANGSATDAISEHLYDGSIIQQEDSTIWDGLVVIAAEGMDLQILQNGDLVSNDFWNTIPDGESTMGLNRDIANGISHRFMLLVNDAGTEIDGRRIIGMTRVIGKTYSEFKVNGTARGNNVLALTYANDLNNATPEGTLAGYNTIVNNNEGYVLLDIDNNGTNEAYYSEWTRAEYTVNDLYERAKWETAAESGTTAVTANGSLYGLNGNIFRGITNQLNHGGTSGGSWVEGAAVTWTGGTGQLLATNETVNDDKIWIQVLTGVAPSSGTVTQGGVSCTVTGLVERPIRTPFIGVSTGSALIGAYGLGMATADTGPSDIFTPLEGGGLSEGDTIVPPNNVQFCVNGLVTGEDRVLVGPASSGELQDTQCQTNAAYTAGATTIVLATNAEAIGNGTPSASDTPVGGGTAGGIRVQGDDGIFYEVDYTDRVPGAGIITFTGCSGLLANAAAGNNAYIAYIDKLAGNVQECFTVVYGGSPRSLFIRVRDGGTAGDNEGIKTFETTGTLGSAGGSTTAIRTSDV